MEPDDILVTLFEKGDICFLESSP